jgi:hypothetical protein
MARYVTPELRRDHFDDWNPGHGLDTVTDTAIFIRDYYGISRVWLIQTPKGVQFKVSGSTQSVREFAALYGD